MMSDSASHNLCVVEEVCKDFNVKEVPGSLLCNVHPLMMFNRKMKELCQKLHDSLGGKKLPDCFLVDVDFQRKYFPIKVIKCLSNFICKDFSARPWSYRSHFGEFIKPK